jgi:hypothetical protein
MVGVTSRTTASRDAGPAITGYAYQFDATILGILGSEGDCAVTVEGHEDFDIGDDATGESVQCKYLESQKFSLTGLRDVLLPMLAGLASGRTRQYRLYAHYGDATGAPNSLTVEQIRSALTQKKRNPPGEIQYFGRFSDSVLDDFARRFRITIGPSYDAQKAAVRSALAHHLMDL